MNSPKVSEKAEIFVDRHMAEAAAVVLVEFLARLDGAGDLQIGFLLEIELAVELARKLDLLGRLIDPRQATGLPCVAGCAASGE
jgi:hypothetical protein